MAWDAWRTGRWVVISILITVAVTALLWALFGARVLFGFLFLPFLPFAFGAGRRHHDATQSPGPACARCGFTSDDPEVRYCPRDGTPLA